jgi:hypothetical protein
MTAMVTVANRKPMSLNPLRSVIAMLRSNKKIKRPRRESENNAAALPAEAAGCSEG